MMVAPGELTLDPAALDIVLETSERLACAALRRPARVRWLSKCKSRDKRYMNEMHLRSSCGSRMGGRGQLRGSGGLPLRGGLTHQGVYMPTVWVGMVFPFGYASRCYQAVMQRRCGFGMKKSVDVTHHTFLMPRVRSGGEEE
jgi:hypothetical protein